MADDLEKLPDFDPNEVKVNEKDVEVKADAVSGYEPVQWKAYADKLEPGILESMKKIFRYQHLTEVQNTIISRMPLEKDLLVRSKTGTGKTLAFLIPAIQRFTDYTKENNFDPRKYAKTRAGTLILSPTRELASQIASEARRILYSIGPGQPKVQVLVGGDPKKIQQKLMLRERNDIIVATPGRLLDYLETDEFVPALLSNIRTLILDETDSLLDMGFRKEISSILDLLKDTEKERLNMMFSATISREVKDLAAQTSPHGIEYVNTVRSTDLDVHQLVNQTYIVRPMVEHVKVLLSLINSEQLKNPVGKVIVFFNTTKQVQLYTLMFRILRRLYSNPHFQQFEIHSKKDQEVRSKVNKAFRSANVGSVLFTSDVSYLPISLQS